MEDDKCIEEVIELYICSYTYPIYSSTQSAHKFMNVKVSSDHVSRYYCYQVMDSTRG